MKAHGSLHDYVDDNGETPMYYAIKQNCGPIAEWLISQGIDLKIVNNRGLNLVGYAQRSSKPSMKELLLKHGAP
jgi:ankyrin repeat protein